MREKRPSPIGRRGWENIAANEFCLTAALVRSWSTSGHSWRKTAFDCPAVSQSVASCRLAACLLTLPAAAPAGPPSSLKLTDALLPSLPSPIPQQQQQGRILRPPPSRVPHKSQDLPAAAAADSSPGRESERARTSAGVGVTQPLAHQTFLLQNFDKGCEIWNLTGLNFERSS